MFHKELIDEINVAYGKKEEILGEFMENISQEIEKIENNDIKTAMKFLYGMLPISDVAEDGMFEILLSLVESAFFARENTSWGKSIPIDIFLSDVLFPRVNSERLEDNRKIFYDYLIDRVRNKSMYEAVVEVNYFSFENATYRSTDMRTVPPTSMLKSAYGRCGEEAIFTVTALRSIGIPARQIYTPRWAHCDNNHAWVEAYCDGKWHYLGACEPEEILDRGWFTSAASRAMVIESRAFYHNSKMSPDDEVIINGLAYNLNHTKRYGDSKLTEVTVVDKDNKPIENAKVLFEIINHGEFSPLNYIYTDKEGRAGITTGLGSLNIHIVKNNEFLERLINTEKENNVKIAFEPDILAGEREVVVQDFDTYAPKDPGNKVKSLDKDTIKNHKENTEKALNIRLKKESGFLTSPSKLTKNANLISKEDLEDILLKAKGNGEKIIEFLSENETKYAPKLLKTLNEKDYTDLDNKVLNAHLNHALQYKDSYNEDVFVNYILSPRIFFETITDYRGFIYEYFTDNEKGEFKKNPASIWEYINKEMKYLENEEFPNTNINPKAALTIKHASILSRKVLFVAICRTLGIPARISPDTIDIEYYDGDKLISPIEEEIRDSYLRIDFEEGVNWGYSTNFTLAVLDNGEYKTLKFKDANETKEVLHLKSGDYRIITANRLPNGNSFCRKYTFKLIKGEEKVVNISIRPMEIENMLSNIEIGDFQVKTENNEEIFMGRVLNKDKNVLIWIEENHEPSQHILNELIDNENALKTAEINLIFLLRENKILENTLIKKVVEKLNINCYYDENFSNQEPVARRTFVDPEKLPLVIITKNGLNSIFALSGYNVGSVDMILKILK